MNSDELLRRYARRVGWSEADLAAIGPDDVRRRHIIRLSQAAGKYSIVAEVTRAEHCSSGYVPGTRFVLDPDGNFIAKLCPRRLCVYLAGQLMVPVAIINERLSEGLDPQAFHFCHRVRCPDVGVACGGYGQVEVAVRVEPRAGAGGS